MTPEQEYLLTCLMEECGEIIQAASKCLRHGPDNHHPDRPNSSNSLELIYELSDLDTVRGLLEDFRFTVKSPGITINRSIAKYERITTFMRERFDKS